MASQQLFQAAAAMTLGKILGRAVLGESMLFIEIRNPITGVHKQDIGSVLPRLTLALLQQIGSKSLTSVGLIHPKKMHITFIPAADAGLDRGDHIAVPINKFLIQADITV